MCERLRSWWAIPTGFKAASIVSRPPGDLERFRGEIHPATSWPFPGGRASRDLLDTVTSRRALVATAYEGYYPLQIP